MQKPYVEHLNAVRQILRYVVRIKDLALKYSRLPSFVLLKFLDSNYGEDRDDRNQPLHMCSTLVQVLFLGFQEVAYYVSLYYRN